MLYKNFETKTHNGMVEINTGDIIAYEKKAQHREFKGHINNVVNAFPFTDTDFIILKARELIN